MKNLENTQNSLWQVNKVNKSSDVSIHLKFPPSFTFSLLLNKASLHLYLNYITWFFIYKCRVFRWIWLSEQWGHGCAEGTCLELFFAPTNSVQSELVNFKRRKDWESFLFRKFTRKFCEIIAIIIRREHISELKWSEKLWNQMWKFEILCVASFYVFRSCKTVWFKLHLNSWWIY